MPTIQIVSIAGCALLLLIVLELVRQRRFLERYALLWLFSALVLLGLARRRPVPGPGDEAPVAAVHSI